MAKKCCDARSLAEERWVIVSRYASDRGNFWFDSMKRGSKIPRLLP